MSLINFCLKRPMVVLILSASLFIFGLFSLKYLSIKLVPLMQSDSVNIVITNVGASPSSIQNEISRKIVNALQSVQGVRLINSSSQAGKSTIDVELDPMSQIDSLQTLTAINQAVSSTSLPSRADQPIVTQTGWRNGLFSFSLYSNTNTPLQLLDYYNEHLQMQLKSIQGVAEIDVASDISKPIIRIKLDPQKLEKYHLAVLDIKNTLDALNQSLPVGKIVVNNRPYLLTIETETASVPAIENLIIGKQYAQGRPNSDNQPIIYLKDVAQVSYEDALINKVKMAYMDGRNALSVSLIGKGQGDPILVTEKVQSILKNSEKMLPPGMHIKVVHDNGVLIKTAIIEVLWTIGLTALLVILICFGFLGRFRNTLIPVITIPICLSGTLLFLLMFGFSVNMFSLLAMVVAIGLVVDDAIVVVEHITVYLEKGNSVKDAVIQGAKEISTTIVGITLTLVAVYIPTLFMTGVYALWYQQFTVTLAICVLISGVLALTLSPLMSY